MNMRRKITNVNIVLPDKILYAGVCCYSDGIIDYIGTDKSVIADQSQDGQGNWLLPGFIDIH